MILLSDYLSSPNIGIFCSINDNVALVPLNCPDEFSDLVKQLDVDIVKTSMANTSVIGIFSALNNNTIIVPGLLEDKEINVLKDHFNEVVVIDDRYTAVGNLITMNNNGILCQKRFAKTLEGSVPFEIAESDLVGSAVFANNEAFICHVDAKQEEIDTLRKVLKINGDIGTVNLGDPFVKYGIIGNKKGLIVGNASSGPELNRIDDVFSEVFE